MSDTKDTDLYAVLGIANQNASQQEIQATYDKRVESLPSDAVELIKVEASIR